MEEIYTSVQVANILQIHPQTVLKFIREGRLKGSKVGRGYRVKVSDIEVFLENTSRQPNKQESKLQKSDSEDVLKIVTKKKVPETDKNIDLDSFPPEGEHYVIQ